MDSKNLIIICVTAIICLAIVAGAFVLLNNGTDDSTVAVDNTTNEDTVNETDEVNTNDDSSESTPRLGSKENPKTSVLIITHYTRILDYIKPEFVHMMKDGSITISGDIELSKQIEKYGYNQSFELEGKITHE